jgi:hypothetical protein
LFVKFPILSRKMDSEATSEGKQILFITLF